MAPFRVFQAHHALEGLVTAKSGARYLVTHQTPTTAVTGQTSFVATTPTFLLRQASSSNRLVLNSIVLSQTGTVAGGDIEIVVAIDSVDRFSADGTLVTPQCSNSAESNNSSFTFRYNPTASAAGAGTRYIDHRAVDNVLGSSLVMSYNDGVVIGATGSILVYTFAATTGPSWHFTFEVFDETI